MMMVALLQERLYHSTSHHKESSSLKQSVGIFHTELVYNPALLRNVRLLVACFVDKTRDVLGFSSPDSVLTPGVLCSHQCLTIINHITRQHIAILLVHKTRQHEYLPRV